MNEPSKPAAATAASDEASQLGGDADMKVSEGVGGRTQDTHKPPRDVAAPRPGGPGDDANMNDAAAVSNHPSSHSSGTNTSSSTGGSGGGGGSSSGSGSGKMPLRITLRSPRTGSNTTSKDDGKANVHPTSEIREPEASQESMGALSSLTASQEDYVEDNEDDEEDEDEEERLETQPPDEDSDPVDSDDEQDDGADEDPIDAELIRRYSVTSNLEHTSQPTGNDGSAVSRGLAIRKRRLVFRSAPCQGDGRSVQSKRAKLDLGIGTNQNMNTGMHTPEAVMSNQGYTTSTGGRLRTKKLKKKKASSIFQQRQRRRRQWTDEDGTPSFLAILTGDTPPPSDDEEEIEDTVHREREWKEKGRFVVDIDAFLGLAKPRDYVCMVEDGGDDSVGAHVNQEARGDQKGAAAAAAAASTDPPFSPAPASTGGSDSGNRPHIKKEPKMRSGKSALYRIGSEVRARIWHAAVQDGSVDPNQVPTSDVIVLSDAKAADPFVAPSLVLGGGAGRAISASVNAHGVPTAVKSESFAAASGPQRYYEGVRSLALSDDQDYLPEFHVVIRRNLELFSATDADVEDKSYGKRNPIVRGKVGIRCIHCSNSIQSALAAPFRTSSMVPDSVTTSAPSANRTSTTSVAGSVSFLSAVATMSNIATQKPAQHFASCPNTPAGVKELLHSLTHDREGNPLRQRAGSSIGGGKLGISAAKYWLIAASRVGLVDVKVAGGGIRFARDLCLPPLSVEEVLKQEPGFVRRLPTRPSPTIPVIMDNSIGPGTASSSLGSLPDPPTIALIKGDPKSEETLERVISEIKAHEHSQNDKEEASSGDKSNIPSESLPYLVTSEDRTIVSSFSFLLGSQLAIVHASVDDMRGAKRAKSVRIGTTGFTCRACKITALNSGYTYGMAVNSFPSGDMALCTTLSQTLYSHWGKCPFIRDDVRAALVAYKKLHPKQIAQFSRGANGRFYKLLWERLRLRDCPANTTPSNPTTATAMSVPAVPRVLEPLERPGHFPLPQNENTLSVLASATAETNDGVLLSLNDENLISDFMLLILKQLTPCLPLSSDMKYRRSVTSAGLCCKYCAQRQILIGSGRTFPSAADNYATSLKENMFGHLVKCSFVPSPIQVALHDLKRLHPDQMAALQFGSQRQYLKALHNRLMAWGRHARRNAAGADEDSIDGVKGAVAASTINSRADDSMVPKIANDKFLSEHDFIRAASGWFCCIRCRMVPLDLRAAGSLSATRPDNAFVLRHQEICAADSFDLTTLGGVVQKMVASVPGLVVDLIISPPFRAFVRSLVGESNDLLVRAFTDETARICKLPESAPKMSEDGDGADKSKDKAGVQKGGVGENSETVDKAVAGLAKFDSSGLWSSFPRRPADTEKAKNHLDDLMKGNEEQIKCLRNNAYFKQYVRIIAPSCIELDWLGITNKK